MDAVTVTKPFLPPLEEYVEELKGIWDRRWLANMGPCHEALERALCEYLRVPHLSLFCNGMAALQVGLRALRITGEVITTPFSFPATTHALYWNGCTPVFCDVDPQTGNLDPARVEALITPRTTAILPVHVYGTPCDMSALERIADTFGLKLIYDAAHAFGVEIGGTSILNHGDVSMLSFHATKVFSTAEGGALVTSNPKLKQRFDYLKNFGFADEITVVGPGTNGKMNELQAALGLVELRHIDDALAERRRLSEVYRSRLASVPGIRLLPPIESVRGNAAQVPIFVEERAYPVSRDALYDLLRTNGFSGRRYFYPLISEFPPYRGLSSAANLPVATMLSRQVICLPIYPGLPLDTVERICELVAHPGRASVAGEEDGSCHG
jgi:dTDP-4-amino-4,6-dideoxygalactose transaminase